jgi:transcriptional regulator with XRE-family HTH domain
MVVTKKRRSAVGLGGISGQLREIITRRGLTAYSIAVDAGLEPSIVSRFLAHERGLTLASLDAIAEALGLRLIERGKRPKATTDERPGSPAVQMVAIVPPSAPASIERAGVSESDTPAMTAAD